MNERIARLRQGLERPLLVSNPVNVRYLTGFKSTNAALLVEPHRVRLYTDFRYADAARGLQGVELVETRRDLYGHLAELLSGPPVAFEAAALTYDRYEALAAGALELVPTRGLVEKLREVKDETELHTIRRAAAITNEAYARLAEETFVGRTERELARRLEQLYLELGADATAFEIGLAAGANGAVPHGKPGGRVIEAGTTVVVDSGARVDGYHSDCTRTFAAGQLPAELARAYEVCLRAQERALAALEPGMAAVELDGVARRAVEWAGLGAHFGHGLGHGVGLDVHEAPWLAPDSGGTLEVGSVVTIEPGIYLSGLGGVRIEDLVVVSADGPEVLTTFPKELVAVR